MRNRDIAELLARAAEEASSYVRRALKRASRAAFLWPVEVRDVIAAERSLTELPRIGPYLAQRIRDWVLADAPVPAPPALRDDFLTRTEAREILARDPSWRARGDLQVHTTWSDGSASIAEMAAAARAAGLEYLAITDHSQGLEIAGGMDEAELARQQIEIARVNDAAGEIRVLRSLEMNLRPDGSGDMAPESLAGLDLVLGAFHSALRRTDDQTARYVAALRGAHVHVLAHPRGRIYNFRLGLRADWLHVFGVAAEVDKAVEIDAYADRQDLNRDLLAEARKAGVRISLGSDAHGPGELAMLEFGLAAALATGIPRERIINFMTADELVAWAASVRERVFR